MPASGCSSTGASTAYSAWGYNSKDHQYKSAKELVHYLVRAAGHNANFLLNIGPRPDGTIQPEFVERLREIGVWMRVNGDSIYGTRQGPVPPRDWGVTTRKDNKVYVHILKLEDDVLALPKLGSKITRASLMGGRKAELVETPLGILLQVDRSRRDPIDTVVVLELR